MNQNNSIEYDATLFEEAVSNSKQLTNLVSDSLSSKSKSLSSSMPKGFKGSSAVGEIASALNSIAEKLLNIEPILSKIRDVLQEYVDDESIKYDLDKMGYFETEIDGVKGWLYIPEGISTNGNTPIITYLPGRGGRENVSNVGSSHGLAKLVSMGLDLNSVVWVPSSGHSDWTNPKVKDSTINSINTLINTYNLDSSRNVLIGYSDGAKGAFQLVHDNPNYFSTCVTYAGVSPIYKEEGLAKMANSGTTFVMYLGESDSQTHKNEVNGTFKGLNNAGADVTLYKLQGMNHNDEEHIFTSEMLNDVLNIKKGERCVQPGQGEIIEVSKENCLNSSIYNNMNEGKSNTNIPSYYKSLSTGNSDKLSIDDLQFDVPIETGTTSANEQVVLNQGTDSDELFIDVSI